MGNLYKNLLTIVNCILYFVIIAIWISIPDEMTLCISVTVFNLVLTCVLIYLNQEKLSLYYQSHQFKKLSETLVGLFLIFSILSLANYWSYKHPVQTDLTVFKMNSLADQTTNIIKGIKGDIKFKLFARKQESNLWMPILELYRTAKNNIEIEKIDIDVRPDLVADYHITDMATLVIEYNGRRQYITERDELNITNGLIKISRSSDPVVYFIQGHGEGDINSSENEGLKFIFEAIRNSAIDVRPLSLISTGEVPFDAKAVILWGPRSSLQGHEIKVLERFLERKGNLLVSIDPDLNQDNHAELRKLLTKFKILSKNDLVIDRKSFVNGSNGSIPMVENFNKENELTSKFKGQVFFPLASSLETLPDELSQAPGKVDILFSSSNFPDSWGETNLKEFVDQNVGFTAGKDRPGPRNLGMSYKDDKNKIIAFGNSTFVINSYLKFGANYTLFLNSLAWLVDEDRLISFNLPVVQSEPIMISTPQLGIIFYFSVIFAPLILFGLSIYMYRRKRDL